MESDCGSWTRRHATIVVATLRASDHDSRGGGSIATPRGGRTISFPAGLNLEGLANQQLEWLPPLTVVDQFPGRYKEMLKRRKVEYTGSRSAGTVMAVGRGGRRFDKAARWIEPRPIYTDHDKRTTLDLAARSSRRPRRGRRRPCRRGAPGVAAGHAAPWCQGSHNGLSAGIDIDLLSGGGGAISRSSEATSASGRILEWRRITGALDRSYQR